MLQLVEQKKNKQKEFMNSSHGQHGQVKCKFPWNDDYTVDRNFWLKLVCLDPVRKGWITEEDVYGGGCFDVGDSFKGFDWIDEPVGFDDRSIPATTVIGLSEAVGDDDLKDTGCSFNNDLKYQP
nr:phospholipase-like protein [Tanacetum cinerariifolium]